MPVRTRLHIPGSGLHFVTTTVTEWIPVFADAAPARRALVQLVEACKIYETSVVAYVLMPSHLHALLGTRQNERLSQLMRSFKSLSSKLVKETASEDLIRRLSISGKYALWQPRFDELTIYSEKQLKIKIEYIHNNPVKDGIVQDAASYPFSSAGAWLSDIPGIVPIDRDFVYQL